MDLNKVDFVKLLASPPAPPGLLVQQYYSLKQGVLSFLLSLNLWRLAKTVDVPTLPPEAARRKRVVVVGGGWAAVSFVKSLDFSEYEVVWVSPNPLFSFTLLLPSVIGGVLPPAACTLRLRALLCVGRDATARGVYRCAWAEGVDFKRREVACVSSPDRKTRWQEPFHFLVLAVGSAVKTFGLKGVEENALFLRTAEDAQKIRQRVLELLERASLPTETEERRKQLLTFVIVGGGPSGVEAAAELRDFLAGEASAVYRHFKQYFLVVVVESGNHLLKSYAPKIQQGAERVFRSSSIKVIYNTRVVEVQEDRVLLTPKTAAAEAEIAADTATAVEPETEAAREVSLPCGLVIWTAGVEPQKIGGKLVASLPEQGEGRLVVDPSFRVKGAPGVFSIGDCCTVVPPSLKHFHKELYKLASDGTAELADPYWLWRNAKKFARVFPQILDGKNEIFKFKKGSKITEKEFLQLLEAVDKSFLPPVPTAQNANSQGKYLGLLFNSYFSCYPLGSLETFAESILEAQEEAAGKKTDFLMAPLAAFVEMRGVALCFLGSNHAALQLPILHCIGGKAALFFWRFVYYQLQVTRLAAWQCIEGWTRTGIFGRVLPAAI